MITLLSGTPGTGKTAYAVDLLVGNQRALFTNIKGLTLPHEPLPPFSAWCAAGQLEFTGFPLNSLIVVDEAQRFFPTRTAGSKVPPHVTALETHRHHGLDFILITQRPKNIDAHIRGLVGKHIHFRQTFAGRFCYEWPNYADVESKSEREASANRRYTIPSTVYPLYESASIHTKNRFALPKSVYVFFLALLVLCYLGYSFYGRVSSGGSVLSPASKPPVNTSSPSPDSHGLPARSPQTPSGGGTSVGAALTPAAFVPRINTRPESAPLYDSVRTVTAIPVVVACVDSARKCRCYTDQATDALLSDAQCREWLRVRPYNPFIPIKREPLREPASEPSNIAPATIRTPAGSVPVSAKGDYHVPICGDLPFRQSDLLWLTRLNRLSYRYYDPMGLLCSKSFKGCESL